MDREIRMKRIHLVKIHLAIFTRDKFVGLEGGLTRGYLRYGNSCDEFLLIKRTSQNLLMKILLHKISNIDLYQESYRLSKSYYKINTNQH